MVQRAQCGHNPDAYDAGPADSGIFHYYSGFQYGGIGFAVLEDRKFKSPPKISDPALQVLLGAKQLQFLEEWSEDWTDQKFKVVVSQSVYAAMHTEFSGNLEKDHDSGGFPKVGRDKAVKLFQRCGAFIVSGDQHLGTFARLGIDKPSDAVYQFCVPAMGNIFWRWFYPSKPGADRNPSEPEYLGEFVDPLGNYFRMMAVANPESKELFKEHLRLRPVITEAEAAKGKSDVTRVCQGDGYGVVRFDKSKRTIRSECWPFNAKADSDKPYEGWPITVEFDELDGRKPVAYLPDLEIHGAADPVVQIIEQETGQVVKITRAHNSSYRPGVFDANKVYTLRVGEPERNKPWWQANNIRPQTKPGKKKLRVDLSN